MAQTNIEWTWRQLADGTWVIGYTFNPWLGCIKVSPGCIHCYAENMMDTRYKKATWGVAPRVKTSVKYWNDPRKWNLSAAADFRTRYVFCASLADWAEENPQLDPWRDELFEKVVEPNRWLWWLMLTKRAKNAANILQNRPFIQNVLPMFSAENQVFFDTRWEAFKPLAERGYTIGVSCEPLLGEIVLPEDFLALGQRAWVIVGGESGRLARPMNIKWVYNLLEQCTAHNVAFLFKQHGEWIAKTEISQMEKDYDSPFWGELNFMPEWKNAVKKAGDNWGVVEYDGTFLEQTTTWNGRQLSKDNKYEHTVIKVGKHSAGRLLGGKKYDGYPAVLREELPLGLAKQVEAVHAKV